MSVSGLQFAGEPMVSKLLMTIRRAERWQSLNDATIGLRISLPFAL